MTNDKRDGDGNNQQLARALARVKTILRAYGMCMYDRSEREREREARHLSARGRCEVVGDCVCTQQLRSLPVGMVIHLGDIEKKKH